MKTQLLLILSSLLMISIRIEAQSPAWIWAKNIHGISNDYVQDMAVDSNGNCYMTGYFNSDTLFLGGNILINDTTNNSSDIFIAKFDSTGDVIWAKSAGGSDHDNAYKIAIDTHGNSYITGGFGSDSISFDNYTFHNVSSGSTNFFIAKYDSSGNVLWAASSIGGTGIAVASDSNQNCYVTGGMSSQMIFGIDTIHNAGSTDVFTVCYDNNGNVVWAKQAGGTDNDRSNGIAADENGNCYVNGYFGSATAAFDTIVLTNAGGNCSGSPCFDYFIVKYNAAGKAVWANSGGGSGSHDNGVCISADASGAYSAGYFSSDSIVFGNITLMNSGNCSGITCSDIFIARYDTSGNVVWANSATGSNTENAVDIEHDTNGNCFLAGIFKSDSLLFDSTLLINSSSNKEDIYVASYNANGDLMWAKAAGGKDIDVAIGIGIDMDGAVYVGGWFYSDSILFDNHVLINDSSGLSDIFLAKLIPPMITTQFISTVPENYILIYPNPAQDYLILDKLNSLKKYSILITNIEGKIIFTTSVTGKKNIRINTKDFKNGIYTIRIQTTEGIETKKLIVDR